MYYKYSEVNYLEQTIITEEAQAQAKRRRSRDVAVLGILLLIYQFSAKLFVYMFYYIAYFIFSGNFSLSWGNVLDYFRDHKDLVNSTAFDMSANISVTAATALLTLLIARVAFKVRLSGIFKTDKKGALTGVKWFSPCFVFNMIASTIIAFFTNMLSSVGVSVPTADFSIKSPSAIAVVMQVSYVVILAPLFEEIIYRGLIIKMVSPYSKSAAVLISALAFGLMHGNIPQAASAFCTGLIYAIIALKSGSIIPTMIIHSLNNLIVNSPDLADAIGRPYNEGVLSMLEICIGLFGFFMWFTQYKFIAKFDDTPQSEEKKLSFKSVMSNPLLIVYFAILVFVIFWRLFEANS